MKALLKTGAAAFVVTAMLSPGAAQAQAGASALDSETDILVTARKRDESLQDVPLAISALSMESLDQQQISGTEDMNLAAPGLSISKLPGGGGISQIYLRGAGQDDSQAAVEPPISIYLDGVPYTKAAGALFDIIEFERIEVLRGPQGTLYGRNSTGGAIKFVTRRPSLTETRFVGDVTVGSFARIDVRGSLTGPLSDTVGAKIDVISRSDDGYVRDALADGANGRPSKLNRTDRQAVRVALLFEPSERLSFYATADVNRDRGGPQSGIPFISSAASANVDANGNINRSRPLFGNRLAAPEISAPNEFDGYGTQLTTTVQLDAATITSIMAYRGFELDQATDTDGGFTVPGVVTQNGATITRANAGNYVRNWKNDTLSWELQAASSGSGPLTWVVGGFLMREKNESDDLFGSFSSDVVNKTASRFLLDQVTRSTAVFGELSYTLFDRLELTAGGRFTRDTKSIDRTHSAALGLPIFSGAPYTGSAKKSWSEFTPRFIARYEFTDDLSVYASYATGFQAGAFQSLPFGSAASSNTPFAPTKVKTIEAGFRSQFFDRRLTANLTVFRSRYTDLPSTISSVNGAFTVFTNDVEIKGVELEFAARPFAGLSLYANGGFFDDKYNRSVVAPSAVPGANGVNRLKYTPDVTFKVGADYEHVFDDGKIAIGGNVAHSGDYFMSTVNTPFAYQKAFSVVDGQVSYESPDARWKLTLGVKNLTDKLYAPRASTSGGGVVFFAPPRTWSLTLRTQL